jgi:hypothetical protein
MSFVNIELHRALVMLAFESCTAPHSCVYRKFDSA